MSESHTVAEHLYVRIREAGVDRVFGVPGDFSLAMLDCLEAVGSPSWVACATELGAGYAADGYARARGLGVLFTTFGVGELSAACAVAGSTAEDVAVLHVVAAPASTAIAAGAPLHHTLADGDLHRFSRSAAEFTRASFVVSGETATDDIDRAIAHWVRARETTYLLLPQDIAQIRVPAASEPLGVGELDGDPEAKTIIEDYLAEHPDAVAVLGHLIHRRGLHDEVDRLIGRGVPIAVLPNGKGAVDESHPAYVGVYNGKLGHPDVRRRVEEDTGRVLIGCVLVDTTTGGLSHRFPEESTLVVGRDRVCWGHRSAKVDIRVAADWVAAMWSGPGVSSGDAPPPPLTAGVAPGAEPLSQDSLWAVISATLPAGTRLFAETGSPHFGALDISFPADTRFECAAVWSAIGYAFPAALGAALADPGRRVFAVIGDGALQMTAPEFGVVDRYGANPVVVVVDNEGYTVERVIRGETASYNDVAAWAWPAVPAALGARDKAVVSTPVTASEFADAISNAMADPNRAHVIVVRTERLDATPTLATMGRMLRAKAEAAERAELSRRVTDGIQGGRR